MTRPVLRLMFSVADQIIETGTGLGANLGGHVEVVAEEVHPYFEYDRETEKN